MSARSVTESLWPEVEDRFPWLAASDPADGASNVPLQARATLRFKRVWTHEEWTLWLDQQTRAAIRRIVTQDRTSARHRRRHDAAESLKRG